jgi:hypothetical protein
MVNHHGTRNTHPFENDLIRLPSFLFTPFFRVEGAEALQSGGVRPSLAAPTHPTLYPSPLSIKTKKKPVKKNK